MPLLALLPTEGGGGWDGLAFHHMLCGCIVRRLRRQFSNRRWLMAAIGNRSQMIDFVSKIR